MDGEQGGPWGSALSVNEFSAIREVGFEPVGQVFGAAVYYLATVTVVSCPGTTAAGYQLPGASPGALPGALPGASPGAAAASGRSLVSGFPGTAAGLAQRLYEGRRTAIERMTVECADLGGHGGRQADAQAHRLSVRPHSTIMHQNGA